MIYHISFFGKFDIAIAVMGWHPRGDIFSLQAI